MTYQPQHETTISPYPLGQPPFVFGATCACGWLWMPNSYERTSAAIREHYVAEAMAIPLEEL
ncbi:hypothetical protein Rhe02_54580 [Rhizocola hellebori]|uniref:Uncharacterized protein n=1 Tax=Rhizocola hellebori TaxID=1392758 RepID=A0A8J3VIT3_9ACTN|nr:hypothetical protein [Rhizocola hellebori]GIH07391.1 hypothetical protein Rhe02_54580 [Rhizocola hellebori]